MKVKVGDKIYLKKFSSLFAIDTVTKITPTMIKSDQYNYKLNGDHLRVTGQGKWDILDAEFETQELKKEWHEKILRNWIARNWQDIPLDEVEKLRAKQRAIITNDKEEK